MFSRNQINQMFTVEVRLDLKAQPGWISDEWNCHRAAILACSVMMEQKDWVCAPVQPSHKESLLSKLADIWHFYVAQFLEDAGGDTQTAEAALVAAFDMDPASMSMVQFDGRVYDARQIDLLSKIKLMVGLAASHRVSVGLLSAFLSEVEIEWLALYKVFVGKNVLDIFRRDHGYRKGRYVMVWNALRDQEHLNRVQLNLDCSRETYLDDIYRGLEARYPVRDEVECASGAER